jgi:hypothetical protein
MHHPIDEDRARNDQQPEHLIPPEDARLLRAPLCLGNQLIMRLDAGLDHRFESATLADGNYKYRKKLAYPTPMKTA